MQKSHHYITALFATLVSLGLVLFALVGTASAHAKVIKATPGIGSTIATAPTTLTVETLENMNPNPKLSNLFVYGPNGELISQGNAKVSLTNPKEMSVTLKQAGNGIYIVHWITVSADDGDPDDGAFIFTVKPAITTSVPAATTATPTTSTTSSSPAVPSVIAAIIALIVGLGAGFGLGRRGARSSATSTETEAAAKTEGASTKRT